MTNDTLRNKIYLAALLHDIGKFWQRASATLGKDGDHLSEHSRELLDIITPKVNKYRRGYFHVLWTNEFLEKYKNHFPEDLREREFFNLAVFHHKPADKHQALIALADKWSSGSDRLQEKNMEGAQENFKETPLRNIFDIINTTGIVPDIGMAQNKESYYYELSALDMEHSKFPQKSAQVNKEKYAAQWEKFIEDFKSLPTNIPHQKFIESLYHILKKHTSNIPSATNEVPVITPLFEHLKTTAAFASCLFDYWQENPDALDFETINRKEIANVDEKHFPVMLLAGDISGIQSFIYNIHSTKASKSLKGRSFYLRLLTDTIIRKILFHKDIDLNWANVLYASGGKFYLLLPNIDRVKKALQNIFTEVEAELFEKHNMRLAFLHESISFRIKTYQDSGKWKTKFYVERLDTPVDVGELWNLVGKKLQFKKEQKFRSFLEEKAKWKQLFEPFGKGGNVLTDAVTGEELAQNDAYLLEEDDLIKYEEEKHQGEPVVSQYVHEQIQLGKDLKDADYVIVSNEDISENLPKPKKQITKIRIAGIYYYLYDEEDLAPIKEKGINAQLIRLNDTDFLSKLNEHFQSFGFWFYGGNKQAEVPNYKREKTFSELTYLVDNFTETPDGNYGQVPHSYLAILRMDVDNLGKIFLKGLSNTTGTFAVQSTLSHTLDWFFSGYLNTLRNDEKYKDHVNIVYSGGDDLFIVGRWDKVFELAVEIRKKFHTLTGEREDLGISGGLVMVRPKFPVSKAAQLAEDYESKAKKGKKDALTVLDEILSWNELFDWESEIKKWEKLFVRDEALSASILHRIQSVYDFILWQKERKAENPNFRETKAYIWQTLYFMARQREKYYDKKTGGAKQGKEEALEFVDELTKKLLNETAFRKYAIIARLTELKRRDKKKVEKTNETIKNNAL